MSDYDKLTVVKLREELVKRGLPKTGLKAALVQRLVEHDAQSGNSDAVPEESAPDLQSQPAQDNAAVTQKALSPVALEAQQNELKGRLNGKDASQPVQPESLYVKEAVSEGEKEGHRESEERVQDGAPSLDDQAQEVPLPQASSAASKLEPTPETSKDPIFPQQDMQIDTDSENLTKLTEPPKPEIQPANASPKSLANTQTQESAPLLSTQTSITGEEILEDSRKRKRRSQTPPPSSIETQKRLKSDKAEFHVELPEDSQMADAPPEIKHDRSEPDSESPLTKDSGVNGYLKTDEQGQNKTGSDAALSLQSINGDIDSALNGKVNDEELPLPEVTVATTNQTSSAKSPTKPSPSDTRFKNLFTAPAKSDALGQQTPYPDNEDRVVDSAIHPATSALYIRELMRPLKPETVKDHLIALATPPDAPADESLVTEFFLDTIRTHCLVGFANVSAAARVRSGLHDRIWPNERDRRPLFVDFVPEEKLKKWIEVEHSATSGRQSKRWEVVYEDEDGEIKAYLQEAGSNTGGLRAAPTKVGIGQGVQGAPSGPRIRESEPRAAQTRPDSGTNFQALDDLFKSTTAKPKLYYQPVAQEIADRRLEKLAAGRGGGRSDEMRRYTFEEDVLVDKAPAFGNRRGGPYAGRGPPPRAYRGRGGGGAGGYRGDGYRGGDSWRDRR